MLAPAGPCCPPPPFPPAGRGRVPRPVGLPPAQLLQLRDPALPALQPALLDGGDEVSSSSSGGSSSNSGGTGGSSGGSDGSKLVDTSGVVQGGVSAPRACLPLICPTQLFPCPAAPGLMASGLTASVPCSTTTTASTSDSLGATTNTSAQVKTPPLPRQLPAPPPRYPPHPRRLVCHYTHRPHLTPPALQLPTSTRSST